MGGGYPLQVTKMSQTQIVLMITQLHDYSKNRYMVDI